ncbi:unnamed protein product [Phytophthora lilii]|uniref:Unnamed protein product n=1 Tax=Phytophthora lilii TaxID=2077276 RepID=A0A9W6TQH6_9STRA|nr:unnamed protein product [Phytophthora lilii]
MASSFLLPPPSTFQLSDTIVGEVAHRFAPLHGVITNASGITSCKPLPPLRHITLLGTDNTDTNVLRAQTAERQLDDGQKTPASRRERCRINQARYRKRQRQHANTLDSSIQQLREEIDELEIKRQKVIRCAPTNQSVWVVATEYFRVFRRGYMASRSARESSCPEICHTQLKFLREAMTEDVTDGDACGPTALLENWKWLSLYHDDVLVQPKRLEQVAKTSILASTTVSLTITESTLRHIYPHLIAAGNGAVEMSSLAKRLLGKRLVLPGSIRFDWDNATSRVKRLETKLDMLTPMLKLLGSLEDVANVFNEAVITLEGRLRLGKC